MLNKNESEIEDLHLLGKNRNIQIGTQKLNMTQANLQIVLKKVMASPKGGRTLKLEKFLEKYDFKTIVLA